MTCINERRAFEGGVNSWSPEHHPGPLLLGALSAGCFTKRPIAPWTDHTLSWTGDVAFGETLWAEHGVAF